MPVEKMENAHRARGTADEIENSLTLRAVGPFGDERDVVLGPLVSCYAKAGKIKYAFSRTIEKAARTLQTDKRARTRILKKRVEGKITVSSSHEAKCPPLNGKGSAK